MGANPLSCHLRLTCKILCVCEGGRGGPVSTLLLDGYIHRPTVLLINNT